MTGASPTIGVGMLGYGFMGRAHAHAYRSLSHVAWPCPLRPELIAIAGRSANQVAEAGRRFGFAGSTTDWEEIVADDRVTLFDNCGPNAVHSAATIAAAQAGQHVICEKPLARDADESYTTWQRVDAAGVKHMCAFNYRFVPAIRLAWQLIRDGELGEIHHFRARYLQSWGLDSDGMSWRFDADQAGSGALGDLGSHMIDLARYLVGEITSVSAVTQTFLHRRAGRSVDVDDAFQTAVEFANGATGTIEASRFCPGRLNQLVLEINGSRGSLEFDLERLNELKLSLAGTPHSGFQTINVTQPGDPFMEFWWPAGHIIGWEHTFVHELNHLLTAIHDDGTIGPHGADLQDGYRAAEVCDAILRSANAGARAMITYRAAPAVR